MIHRRRITYLTIAVTGPVVLLLVAGATALASPLAGEGGWPPPTEVSQSGDSTSRSPGLEQEDDGTLHALWIERAPVASPSTFTIFHANSTDGGDNWFITVPLTPSDVDRYQGAMDVDDDGGRHLIWHENPGDYQIWYAQLLDTGWEELALISATEDQIVGPDVEAAGDWVHALWSENTSGAGGTSKLDLFYSRSESGEVWTVPITAAQTEQTSMQLSIAADRYDNVHVVWQENADPPEIMYISGTVYIADTVWSAPVTVSLGLSQSASTPCIAVGTDDVVRVVFGVDVENQEDVQDVYVAQFPIWDTDNISPTLIPGSRVDISQLLPTNANPAIALFGTEHLHVAWNGMKTGDSADRIYYSASEDGGTTWSEPVPATPRDGSPDGLPALAADGEFVHLLYLEGVPLADEDIYYTKLFPFTLQLPLSLKAY